MDDIGTELSRMMNECAEALIVKHRLRNAHGEVACWNCHGRPATMPSLHCTPCLLEWRAGKLKTKARYPAPPSAEDDGR